MIELNEIEKAFILAIKRHFHKYLSDPKIIDHSWNNYLQPLYMFFYNKMTYVTQEEYNYHIFKIVMDIYLKIGADHSGCNHNLYSIFNAAFTEKSWRYSEATPIERVISQVCGLIQSTSVFNDKTGARFDLTISEERKEEIGKGLLEEIRYRKEELHLEEMEKSTFNKGHVILFFRWCEEQGKEVLSEKLQRTLDNFGETQLSFNLFIELIEEHLEDEFYYRGVLIEYFRHKFQETNPKFEDKEVGKEESQKVLEDQDVIKEKELVEPSHWSTVKIQASPETIEFLISQVQEYGVVSGLYDDISKYVDDQILTGALGIVQPINNSIDIENPEDATVMFNTLPESERQNIPGQRLVSLEVVANFLKWLHPDNPIDDIIKEIMSSVQTELIEEQVVLSAGVFTMLAIDKTEVGVYKLDSLIKDYNEQNPQMQLPVIFIDSDE